MNRTLEVGHLPTVGWTGAAWCGGIIYPHVICLHNHTHGFAGSSQATWENREDIMHPHFCFSFCPVWSINQVACSLRLIYSEIRYNLSPYWNLDLSNSSWIFSMAQSVYRKSQFQLVPVDISILPTINTCPPCTLYLAFIMHDTAWVLLSYIKFKCCYSLSPTYFMCYYCPVLGDYFWVIVSFL